MAKQTDHPRIDPQFRTCLPQLDTAEFELLEQMCLRDGIRDPIVVWKNGKSTYVVDGHHRLKIAKRHNLPYGVKILDVPTRDDVMAWMAELQLSRRNVNLFSRIEIALRFKDYYQQQAREHLRIGRGRGRKGNTLGGQGFKPIDTLNKLAEIAGAGRTRVAEVSSILKNGGRGIIEKCRIGEFSIRNAYLKSQDRRRRTFRTRQTNASVRYRNPNLTKGIENKIMRGDVLSVLKSIPDATATCVITSVPYNCRTDYGFGANADDLPYHDEYLPWLGMVFTECCRTLRKGGRLIVNCDAVTNRQDVDHGNEYKRPIYADLVALVRQLDVGLKFRDEICWYKYNGVGKKAGYGSYRSCSNPIIRRNHEHVLVWSKNQWHLPNVTDRLPDLTPEEFEKWTFSVWEIYPITRRASGHPTSYPLELPTRLIKLYSYPGDLILDPFVGSGTTTVAAASLGRSYLGIDRNSSFCAHAKKRTETAHRQWLKQNAKT